MVVERRHTMHASAFDRYLAQQVRSRRDARAIVRRVEEHEAAEARENAVTWDAMEASLPLAAAAVRYLRVAIPSGPRHLVRLSKQRCVAYEAHLRGLIDEALSAAPAAAAPVPASVQGSVASPAPRPTPSTAVDARLCGLCGGGCCVRGGDTAYLTVATLRRVTTAQPQLDAAQLLSAYMDRLPARTEAGSCINHTARGCVLPRELRSDTCNGYACDALRTVTASAVDEPSPPAGVLVIRRELDRWAKAGLHGPNAVSALALITGMRGGPARTVPLALAARSAEEREPGLARTCSAAVQRG